MPAGADPQRVADWLGCSPSVDELLVRRFERQAALTPAAIALTCAAQSLTYRQLNEQANVVAHALLRAGVARGDVVAVFLEPSAEMLAVLIGVLKAGAAWVPLDPTYPRERLQAIVAQAAPRHFVTSAALALQLPVADAGPLLVDSLLARTLEETAGRLPSADFANPAIELHPDDLCYLMFTSGSTGVPNGVMVTHGNIAGLFANVQDRCGFSAADSWSAMHSFAFGFSVWEMWGPLTTGGRLVIVPTGQRNDPFAWVSLLLAEKVSVLSITPSAFRQWLASDNLPELAALGNLRLIVFSGEAVRSDDLQRWFARYGEAGPQLVNTYALTETAGRVALLVYAPGEAGEAGNIGLPAADANLFVVDAATGQILPPGAVGELLIAGPMVARGYLHNPALTAQRFVDFDAGDGIVRRCYRSGDLARRNTDGTFCFTGRADAQVKLRGYRIELQDIEQVLRRHPGVADAAVVLDDSGPAAELCAWVVAAADARSAVELWPSLGEYQVYDPLLYDFMSADEVRVASYRRAFERTVRDKVVLDIGTGKDALLARLCAAAGARKVYAVEVLDDACAAARTLIQELGLDDRIVVIQGDMQTIELPEAIEVCTQGIVGNIGSSDGIATIWNSARRLFAPHAIAIPSRCETLIVPAQLPAALRATPAFTPLAAAYAERIFATAGGPFDVRLCVRNFPLSGLLAAPAVFEDLDFTAALPTDYSGQVEFEITQAGLFDGFLLWTRIQTDASESVDFLQHQQAWLPVWFPVADEAFAVQPGDRIHVQWRCTTPAGQIFPDYAIETVVAAAGSPRAPQRFSYRSAHYGDAPGQTEMHRRLFAAAGSNQTAAASEPAANMADLAAWAREQLPAHMVPARWEPLIALPLNRNGKLDRRALQVRATAMRGDIPVAGIAYADHFEAAIAGLWCRVLGRETIGRDEEFFAIGGDSILAVRLTTEVQRYLDDAVFLAALFDAPTVGAYAAWLRTNHAPAVARRLAAGDQPLLARAAASVSTSGIVPARDPAPLSWPQQSLWILQQLYPDSTAANEQFLIRVSGGANAEQLRSAWHAVLAAHDILRTCFVGGAADPLQKIAPLELCTANDATPVCDLRSEMAAVANARLRADAADDIALPFDLSRAPLLRTRLYRMPADELVLLVTAHHIVADGLCVGLIRDALASAYAAGSLPRPALQYADFSLQQRQQVAAGNFDAELDWWQAQLAGHDAQLLSGNPDGVAVAGRECRIEFVIAAEIADRLRGLARTEGATLFMLLLAAWRVWLQRCFGVTDLLIGAPVTLRRDATTAGMLGCMVNNVVFRNPGEAQRSFRALLQAEREAALAAFDHSTVPFEKLVETLQPTRTLGRHPLFQLMFMFDDRSALPARAGDVCFNSDVLPVDRASYWDLELSVTDCGIGKALPTFVGVRTDLFDADALATWPEGFVTMLAALAADPDKAISELPVLSDAQRQRMLGEWNATQMPVAPALTLHGLFAAQAARSPASIAVRDACETLTYAELQDRAARYAAVLAGEGINSGARVALGMPRTADSIALLIAVLQRGACWLPLDPAYPAARLTLMADEAQPDLIIVADHDHDDRAGSFAFATRWPLLSLADLRGKATVVDHASALAVETTGADAAYILFTSGSTGRPKGALSTHRGAVSRCLWMWRELRFTATEVFAQRTSLNFVDSIWEIFGPLLHGARLVVLPAEHEQDPAAMTRWLRQEQITHLVTVPVLLDALLTASAQGDAPAALRSVISSGEALSPMLARRCAAIWPQAELINTYGTSETWDASYFRVPASQELRVVPIGKPVANAALYILDANGQPVPPGVVGELYVGGLALAREYVSNPALTQERFVANPFATESAARLYRTGDLASYRADGNIILAGRADRQIKLRGLRIEAGEIESRALEFPGVQQCALRLQQPAEGEPWLALYVVADAAMLDTQALRACLQGVLPRALVPADICVLDKLPLTPSGKLDANALPALPTPAAAAGSYVAPRDAAEERLAAIWQTALGVPQVGVHDDFFALRGHSLLAVQVIARICDEFAVELPLQALFETPTVAGLARSVAALRWARPGQASSDDRGDDSGDDRGDERGDEREVVRL